MAITTRLAIMATYLVRLLVMGSPNMSMVTKLTKVVTYCKELFQTNSRDSSMKWSGEVTWQIKYIILPLVMYFHGA